MAGLPAFFGRITRPHFHGYTAATRIRPEWVPGNLVYQGGVPNLKAASLAGGGQIYMGLMRAKTPNLIYAGTLKIASTVGGGQIPFRPPSLQALLGGARGVGS